MSATNVIDRDERTVAVENAGYRWGYILLTFGLLLDVAWRGWWRGEAAWDLLALVFGGSLVSTLYLARYKALGRGWAWKGLLAGGIAAVLAAATAAALALLR
jgi:hypothetical protein